MVKLLSNWKEILPAIMRFDTPLEDIFSNRSHVRILRALHRLPRGLSASGRALGRRAGVTHPTALKALARLITTGLVTVDRRATGDEYRLNRDHLLAADVATLFDSEAGTEAELAAFLRKRLAALGSKVETATLFGSAVWGASSPESDIDLAV